MRKIIFALLVLACAVCNAQDATECTIRYKGHAHTYYLYIPSSAGEKCPLVMVLHGYGGKAEGYRPEMMEVAAEEGFALCYPQGEANSVGKTGWNVGYPSQADLKSDDIAYIRFLAKALVKKHGFSARNVFLSGMSNGGEMCYLQAYSGDRTFAAIASVAGLTMKWIYDTRKPLRPVPFLELHGTADKTSLWEGDPAGEHGWGGYIAVPAAVAAMIAADGCTAYSREEPAFPRSDRVTLHRFSEGQPAWKGGPPCEVLLYQIDGGAHSWSLQDLDTCREIWRFFKKWMR